MELRQYWRIVWKRWWLIAALLLIVLVLSLLTYEEPAAVYQATMRFAVGIEGSEPVAAISGEGRSDAWLASEYLADDLSQVLRGGDFAARIGEAVGFSVPAGSIFASREHRVMTVSISSTDSEQLQTVAETLAAAVDAMEKLAETVPPGSNGVQAIFSDVMNSKCWKHAPPSLMGFDILAPEHSGKKECIRAIEENAAYVSLGHLHILQELTGSHPDEIVFCGGSSKGFLWPQIVADVLGRRLRIPEVRESTSLGAAICVGVALGFYSGIDDAAHRLVRWERVISPDMKHHAAYQEHYRRWRELYARVLPIGDQGLLPSMWRAPGV